MLVRSIVDFAIVFNFEYLIFTKQNSSPKRNIMNGNPLKVSRAFVNHFPFWQSQSVGMSNLHTNQESLKT